MSVLFTLVGIQAKQGVLAAEADAECSAGRGSTFGVRNLHEVDVAVDGNEVHTAQRVRGDAGLSEGGPHLVPQLKGKLEQNRKEEFVDETLSIVHEIINIIEIIRVQ